MKIIKVKTEDDIPEAIKNTPIAALLRYHNMNAPAKTYESAQILVGMCMDNRKNLRIPDNFAYIIRTGGGNLRYSEFKVSYAIAIGGVKAIALIAHNQCGMVNLISQRENFINGLVKNANWDRQRAEEHFMNYAPMFEIDNETEFVLQESKRLADKYTGIMVTPLYYHIEDNMLSLIYE